MAYIESILMDNEKIIYQTKPHWIIYGTAVIWLIASLLLNSYFGPRLDLNMIMFNYPLYKVASFILLIFALYFGVGAFIYSISAEFAVTNYRIIMKTGFIQRNSLEILLEKVESVHVVQSILGRILSFGTIIINGVGGTKDPFPNIFNPLKFREIVQQQSEKMFRANHEK